jgi:hypothetical protein
MQPAIDDPLRVEKCRRCGVGLAPGDDRHRATLRLRQPGMVAWIQVHLCGPCADDFATPGELQRHLERLLLA